MLERCVSLNSFSKLPYIMDIYIPKYNIDIVVSVGIWLNNKDILHDKNIKTFILDKLHLDQDLYTKQSNPEKDRRYREDPHSNYRLEDNVIHLHSNNLKELSFSSNFNQFNIYERR